MGRKGIRGLAATRGSRHEAEAVHKFVQSAMKVADEGFKFGSPDVA